MKFVCEPRVTFANQHGLVIDDVEDSATPRLNQQQHRRSDVVAVNLIKETIALAVDYRFASEKFSKQERAVRSVDSCHACDGPAGTKDDIFCFPQDFAGLARRFGRRRFVNP